jgi:imidazole glycerol-phosphate synthase subunit HisH
MITVIDCGMGNSGSVLNMIRKVGGEAVVTSDADAIAQARKLVLPGVGAFDAGMRALQANGIADALRYAATTRQVPFMGICLGMQLMLEFSEEGALPGLGLLPGRVKRFRVEEQGLRVPHMGWNTVRQAKPCTLLNPDEGEDDLRYYFVHSYYVECADVSDVCGVTHHGHDFVSMFERGNLMGVQYHPEKSHRFGMQLFHKFVDL